MSIDVERNIPGDEQESEFTNATLQSGPPGYEFSIAVHVDVPMIGVYDQETLERFLRKTFEAVADDPRVSISVQMGLEGSGERWYLDGLQACAVEELPRFNEQGVTIFVHPELDSQGFNTVTLMAESPVPLMQFVRTHWGESDQEWLRWLEDEGLEYGKPPVYS